MITIPAIPDDAGNLRPAQDMPLGAIEYVCDGAQYIVYMPGDPLPAAAEPSVDVVKAAQTALVNATANAELAQITATYPDLEVATWDQQYAEAQTYSSDATALTPLLSAIASACGQSVPDLAAGVIQKAAAYQASSGTVIGKRIALCAQIEAATTADAVRAINW